jgi:transcriptional regulator MftR-like protein
MVEALETAPDDASPMDAVGAALDASARMLGGRRDWSQQRQSVISAHAELRERELIKMARLADALAAGLVDRGVAPAEAKLAAEMGIAVFRIGFERWVAGPRSGDLATALRESLTQLRELSGQGTS